MTITTLSSREFNQCISEAKRAANRGPVVITDRGRPAHVLLNISEYQWLDNHVLPTFAGRILPIDTAVAQRSARLHVPGPQPVRDALIAATALVPGMTLVTRNVVGFKPTRVPIINPWNGANVAPI